MIRSIGLVRFSTAAGSAGLRRPTRRRDAVARSGISVDVSASATAIGSTGLALAWTDGTFVANDFWLAVGANCPTSADATGSVAVTASGTPLDAYDFRVKVTRAAATPSAGAAVKVSLDGGRTYGDEVSIVSGSYAVPNTGVTFAFSAALTISSIVTPARSTSAVPVCPPTPDTVAV